MAIYQVLKTCKDKNSGEILKAGVLVSCTDTRRANQAIKSGHFKPMEVVELKTASKAKTSK